MISPGIGLILLAGGQSRRMGQDKALLSFAGEPMVKRLLRRLDFGGNSIVLISANQPEPYQKWGIPVVADDLPGAGPLAGIQAGLRRSPCTFNLVVACDLPFASAAVARRLSQVAEDGDYDAVVPVCDGRAHPLFSIYHRRLQGELDAFLQEGKRRVGDFLDRVQTRYVTESFPSQAFFNFNRPEDYRRAEAWEEE